MVGSKLVLGDPAKSVRLFFAAAGGYGAVQGVRVPREGEASYLALSREFEGGAAVSGGPGVFIMLGGSALTLTTEYSIIFLKSGRDRGYPHIAEIRLGWAQGRLRS